MSSSLGLEITLQRLFSTFAEGRPGLGLLLQRVLTAIILFYCGGMHLAGANNSASNFSHLIGAVAGVFLLLGLWTPLAGTAIAVVEVWILFAGLETPLITILLACQGATQAMIGPGVWSVDAQLYGRKHIELIRR